MADTKIPESNQVRELEDGKEYLTILLPKDWRDEPICNAGNKRLSLFPIQYHQSYLLADEMEKLFWVAGEIDKTGDRIDFNEKLTPQERHVLLLIFGFFANADNAVLEILQKRVMSVINIPEASRAFAVQCHFESIHVVTYNRLLEEFLPDLEEREKLFQSVETNPAVKPLIMWCLQWATRNATVGEMLVAAAAFEMGFMPMFQVIFVFRKRKLLKGTGHANEKIMEDELKHVQHWAALYSEVKNKLSTDKVHAIIQEVVELLDHFSDKALPSDMDDLNAEMLKEYTEVKANDLCGLLKVPPMFPGAVNPFSTDLQTLTGRTAQFEAQVAEYQKTHSTAKIFSTKLKATDMNF